MLGPEMSAVGSRVKSSLLSILSRLQMAASLDQQLLIQGRSLELNADILSARGWQLNATEAGAQTHWSKASLTTPLNLPRCLVALCEAASG